MHEFTLLLTCLLLLSSTAIEIPEGGFACKPDPQYPDEVCCGLYAYSPDFDDSFCCNGIVVGNPSGCTTKTPAYDINKQVCLYGQTIVKPTNCPQTNNMVHYCCGGEIRNVPVEECVPIVEPDDMCCHLTLYSIDFRHCCGALVVKHGLTPYVQIMADECEKPPAMDPEYQWCEGGDIYTADAPNCPGGLVYYCCGFKIWPKSGSSAISCGGVTYDPAASVCCSDRLYPSNAYMCCDGQVQAKPIEPDCCGKMAYSRLAHRCEAGQIVNLL